VASAVGTIADIVGSYAPGPVGLVAKGLGTVFNDPRWYREFKSGGLTTNVPLRYTEKQSIVGTNNNSSELRPYLLEFISGSYIGWVNPGSSPVTYTTFVSATCFPEEFVATYVVPQVRHVLNAVPLQSTLSYMAAFNAGATLRALLENLKKYEWYVGHQPPVIPPFAVQYPITNPTNFAVLQALIRRITITLSGRIRLPNVLNEMLTWRYGRMFRTNPSEKAALVSYNVIPWNSEMEAYQNLVTQLEGIIGSNAQAAADLFNAYNGHRQDHPLIPGSEMHYDCEEFVLRTNLDIGAAPSAGGFSPNLYIMDSALENDSVFQATSLSAWYPSSLLPGVVPWLFIRDGNAGNVQNYFTALMPVIDAFAHVYIPGSSMTNLPTINNYLSFPNNLGWLQGAALASFNVGGAADQAGQLIPTTSGALMASMLAGYGTASGRWDPSSSYSSLIPQNQFHTLRAGTGAVSSGLSGSWNTMMQGAGNSGLYVQFSLAIGAGVVPTALMPVASTSAPAVTLTSQGGIIVPFSSTNLASPMVSQSTGNDGPYYQSGQVTTSGSLTYVAHSPVLALAAWIAAVTSAKALDFYNCDIGIGSYSALQSATATAPTGLAVPPTSTAAVDLTAISIDAGLVPSTVLQTVQRVTFANLVNPDYVSPNSEVREDQETLNRALSTITGR